VAVKGPYLPSVSPAVETRRKTHTATTFSCIAVVYVRVFWFESCLGNTLFDTILCVIMQGIIYLHPTGLVRGCARHVFSIAFDSSSPLNNE